MSRKENEYNGITQKYCTKCFDGRGQKRGNKRAKTSSNKVVRQAEKKEIKTLSDEI